MGLVAIDGVLPLPTGATEILEALEIPTEIGAHDPTAHSTQRVLQIGVYLNLQREISPR